MSQINAVTVSEAARKIGATPKDVSDLFYRRIIPDDAAPVIGGRRMIPLDLLWLVEAKLIAPGKLAKRREAAAGA
jgi:hypothetical protein